MNKEVADSCLGWEEINNRILIAGFMTKKSMSSIIIVYIPVEWINRDDNASYKFYLQLH
jgi:uncharacterized protein (DUF2132 family)